MTAQAKGPNAFQILARVMHKTHDAQDEYPGLVFVRQEFIDHSRWAVTYLDVYLHVASDTYAGLLYRVAATEMQDEDGTPELVAVEVDRTPRFRMKRTLR